ncbi:MAG TPA: hypothetical protein DEA96_17705 [Leptospiraceae bacterium]|nr:hypothetical protein [Spirochaetaceae bacterium]HBS06810.1 hypothetical protein [Leptospiraceae bacterium]|tara:strand:+ start:11658 stop:12629 length:972 start_codon:yes stop_codon:yes gene_type:complete
MKCKAYKSCISVDAGPIWVITSLLIGSLLFSLQCAVGNPDRPASGWELQRTEGQSFSYEDAQINYLDIGSGPVVLLIHGGGTWSYSFRSIAVPLAKKYRVLILDIPGHGYSEIPESWTFTLSDVTGLLAAFLDDRGVEKAHVVGNSWGGGWAMHFALSHPEKYGHLVLIDTAGHSATNEFDSSTWPYLAYPVLDWIILSAVDREAVARGYRKDLFYDGSLVSDRVIEEIANPFLYSPNLWAQASYEKNLNWTETGTRLNELRNVTIIWGRQDRYLPLELGQIYKERIPHSELIIMEKAGHLPHEERPEEMVQTLMDIFAHPLE